MPVLGDVIKTDIVVLGIAGRAGVGKSTLAKYLSDRYGFMRLSFASPLKGMMSVLVDNCSSITEKEKPVDELCGKSLRYGLQTLGTEWGRNMIGEDIWVRYANKHVALCTKVGYRKFVFDDVRFDNEAEFIKSFNDEGYGIIINMLRNAGEVCSNGHASESGIDRKYVDWVLGNNDSIESMYRSFDEALWIYEL